MPAIPSSPLLGNPFRPGGKASALFPSVGVKGQDLGFTSHPSCGINGLLRWTTSLFFVSLVFVFFFFKFSCSQWRFQGTGLSLTPLRPCVEEEWL